MGIQVKRTANEPLPPGTYTAIFEELTQEEGKFGPQLKAKFLIEDENFAGKTLTSWASLTFSPKSKLFGWVKAAVFGGRDVPDSYQDFDSDHLIGRRVFLVVDTAKGSDGELYNKVTSVLPYRPPNVLSQRAIKLKLPSARLAANFADGAQPTPAPRPAQPQPTPNEPPDWPGWDEIAMTDPMTDPGAEDVI